MQELTLQLVVMSLVSFNLEQFLSLSIFFLTLTFYKSIDQLFFRMYLNLNLLDVSS